MNIVSKNALVSGPNNAAYGSAKAAQLHLSRLNAAELGADKIRVNVVNPDAVISDSKIWEGAWAEGRAKAYGISVDQELPAYYAKRTLLNEIILPEDIAHACFAFVGGTIKKIYRQCAECRWWGGHGFCTLNFKSIMQLEKNKIEAHNQIS